MKRRSEETAATRASPRLRSASRSRSSISLRLVGWARSRPCTCKSFKVMLSPDQKGLRLRQNRKQEVIPLRQLLPELSLGDEHWVDLSGKAFARRGQRLGEGPPPAGRPARGGWCVRGSPSGRTAGRHSAGEA